MNMTLSAEDIFDQVQQMPTKERVKFFALIATNAFQKVDFSHEEVFGHLKSTTFTADEAAQYLEVSMPTFRRYVQSGKLKPKSTIGRSQLFASPDLRKLKMRVK